MRALWLRDFFKLRNIVKQTGGVTVDPSAMYGYFALIQNLNNYSEQVSAPINAGAGFTMTTVQYAQGIVNITAASGAFNITLPTTTQIIGLLQPGVPADGSYAEPISILNNGSGQVGTLVAGDGNTTINGTATIANNTRRLFQVNINAFGPGVTPTLTIQNLGSMAL